MKWKPVQAKLVAGLRVGRPVGVLPPWGIIAVAAPWPMGTQPPLATQALTFSRLMRTVIPHLVSSIVFFLHDFCEVSPKGVYLCVEPFNLQWKETIFHTEGKLTNLLTPWQWKSKNKKTKTRQQNQQQQQQHEHNRVIESLRVCKRSTWDSS